MASRVTGVAALAALIGSIAAGSAAIASAQTEDAGAPVIEPVDPHPAAATAKDPNAQGALPAAAEPGAAAGGFPKALTPQQALPENLQGWLRERNRRQPTMARPTLPAAPSGGAVPARDPESDLEGYRRRLLSFNEDGVTVLSNRQAQPAAPVAQVRAAVAVPAPAPAVVEAVPDSRSVTEMRSLRANQPRAPRAVSDEGLGWPVFAVPVAVISLALLWLRKRRTADS